MINYSARAAKALGYLKRKYNDIEVYVEDTSSPNMWIRLLESILPSGTKLRSVNLLAGRRRVIEACRLDQKDDGRRKLYITDGDFDYLLGKGKPRLKFLHRMPCYCVENLLSQKKIVSDAAFTCCTKTTFTEINSKIENVFGSSEAMVRALFVVYATSEKLETGIKTVAFGVHRLLSKIDGKKILDEAKIRSRILEVVKGSIRSKGSLHFSRTRKEITKRAASLPIEKVVSGKDFVFPLIWLRLKELRDFSSELDHFKVHLAKAFDKARDPLLARSLLKLAS
ncbi:DUF4435 domain-containing protein [Sinorhizobium meliloti]|uniref:DUF4435 domain-containing protein n=1 Tax=Rhizobium meliloti TaxID=382 RepID=UPI003F189EAC